MLSRASKLVASIALGLVASGCSASLTVSDTSPVRPISGPAPTVSKTPMRRALSCLAGYPRPNIRVGVSDIVDGTGTMEGGAQNSRALSQRPDMMMIIALSRAGTQLVNRSSVSVAEWELNKAMEKKLGEGRASKMGEQIVPYRPVRAGGLVGSTHYVTGAITELNWNLDAGVAEAGGYSFGAGRRVYRISIALDIMVTETETTRVVYAESFNKQLIGIETNSNFFRFFANNAVLRAVAAGSPSSRAALDALEIFNANLSDKKNEPMQTSLRWVIDKAAYNIISHLLDGRHRCDAFVDQQNDDTSNLDISDLSDNSAPPLKNRSAPLDVAVSSISTGAVAPKWTTKTTIAGESEPPRLIDPLRHSARSSQTDLRVSQTNDNILRPAF